MALTYTSGQVAAANPLEVVLTFNQPLLKIDNIEVFEGANALSVAGAPIKYGTTCTITLVAPVVNGQVITVNSRQQGASLGLADLTTETASAVTNNVPA